jgi:predicted transcriptional regulator
MTQEKLHGGVQWTSQNRPHEGFFRVSEEAIRLIAKKFDKASDTRSAMNCYVTLCRKVNLKGGEIFADSIREIAKDMACSWRDAQKALRSLEAIGLVHVQRRKVPGTKMNAPSVYAVRTFLQNVTRFRQDVRTSREDAACSTFPQHSQEHPQEIHTYIPKEGRK